MAKQEELRALIDAFKSAVRVDARYAHLDGPASNETSSVAEKRIFSFFDQMRQTIDGLVKTIEDKDALSLGVIHDRDEAVRQVKGLYNELMAAQGEMKRRMVEHMDTVATYKKALEDRGTPIAEDTFVPFDLSRWNNGEGLEVLVGMPGAGTWHAATYIGASPKGFHVVDAEGRGIVAVTDPAACLRHRVKAKTVTLHINVYKRGNQYSAGCISIDRNESLNQMTNTDYVGTFPVKVTVAE